MNRVAEANAALDTLLTATFPSGSGYTVVRNPKGAKAWPKEGAAVVWTDDQDPETVRTLTGGLYDLKLTPEVVIARRTAPADREADQWADVETLKAALAADVTLGGAVEDARVMGVGPADLDEDQWIGGGLEVRIRLLFAAPSAAG